MPDKDVFERAVNGALKAATAAAEAGKSVEEIADTLARGLCKLIDRCLACPALADMGRAVCDFYDESCAGGPRPGCRRAAELWLALEARIEEAERRWFDLPCARVAALAAERVAVDAERAAARGEDFDVWCELERRYAEALADNVWLSRVSHRLGHRPVAWVDDLLREVSTRVDTLVGRWAPRADGARRPTPSLVVKGGAQ